MLTNANFISAITNINKSSPDFQWTNQDVYISYLPLAHVYDRLGCHSLLGKGGSIGFFGGNILKITEDM